MLKNLHIKNLALIREIDIDFTEGLNILTGETGAGKSIIIDSITLALGGKTPRNLLREDAPYGLVELVFLVNDPETIEALRAGGVEGIALDFTLPDLVDCLAGDSLTPAQLATLRDRLDAKDAAGVAAIAPRYLPLIEAAGPFDAAIERLRAIDAGKALATRLDGLAEIAASIE